MRTRLDFFSPKLVDRLFSSKNSERVSKIPVLASSPRVKLLLLVKVIVDKIGNTVKKPGWTLASGICAVEEPLSVYCAAPKISFDIKDPHRQCKIKFSKVDKK